MRIEWGASIDWEPLRIRVELRQPPKHTQELLIQHVRTWLNSRGERVPGCTCTLHYLNCSDLIAGSGYTLVVEWMCSKCVEALVADLEKQVGQEVEKVRIGDTQDLRVTPHRHFIDIDEKDVRFEDGTRVTVKPFQISNYAVSVGEFEKFTQNTDYIPVAVRRGDTTSYKQNIYVEFHGDYAMEDVDAHFLCYTDALAYCDWARYRLPSEAEWLAASLLTDKIYLKNEIEGIQAELGKNSNCLMSEGLAITSDRVNGLVIARRAPFLFKEEGWERAQNRELLSENDCKGILYVCKR